MDLEDSQWRKHVPVVALTIAIFALLFAVMVLYPWHIQLSSDIAAVSRKISSLK
jgi:hypothetical protein